MRNIGSTLLEMYYFRRDLKSKHYDLVVDLQGLLRSGIITRFAKATEKVGYADAREGSSLFYDKKISVHGKQHAVDRNLAVARAIGANADVADFSLKVHNEIDWKLQAKNNGFDNYIVMIPSARWSTKRWPAASFAALIRKLAVPCLLVGTSEDHDIARQIVKASSTNAVDVCGRTGIKELVSLIAGAQAVVSNDSGPLHIAAALDRPTIALFGPTDPAQTGPYGWQRNKKLKVIRTDMACSPCRKKKCNVLTCMKSISVDSVHEALKEFLL